MNTNVERALHETISFHEALRRLGYAASDIFVQCSPDGARGGQLSAFTLLRVRGLPEVTFTSGQFVSVAEVQEFEAAWPHFVAQWNAWDPTGPSAFTDADRQKIYDSSFVVNNSIALITVLLNKGHTVELARRETLRRWFNA